MILPLVAGLALAVLPVPTLDGHLAGPDALARDGSDRSGGRSSDSAGGGYSSGGGGSSSSSSGGSVSSSGGFGGGGSGGSSDSGRSYGSTGVSSVSGGNGGNFGGGNFGGGNFGVGGGADAAATARTIARGEAAEQRRGLGGFRDGLFGDAFGGDRESARAAIEQAARERYSTAMGIDQGADRGGRESALDAASVRLDDRLTEALVARGWQGDAKLDGTGFRNHGERVQGMVEIAKALGYGAHVGALQAQFGGPHDGGQVTGDAPEFGESPISGEKVVEVRSAAVSEGRVEGSGIAVTSPGVSAASAITWDGDWRTADLDLNGDGTVDDADVALARSGETAP